MSGAPLMHLAMVSPGETVRLVSVEGGLDVRKRLADLGLNIGESLSVIQSDSQGPMILAVKESRLALGRGVAHKLLVEAATPQNL
ncbi:MAG: ferrous iron transport protein A [Anaerolineae bacterium]|nr:ferrous iron transport protein A [Anaerolineae bacterium]